MKRTLATMGVVGLALLGVTAPAYAKADLTICHNGGELTVDLNAAGAVTGHTKHPDDIIPPNAILPEGFNWPQGGDPAKPCAAVVPPVVVPPIVVTDPPPVVVVPPVVVTDPPPVVVPPIVVTDPPPVVVVPPVVVTDPPPVAVPPVVPQTVSVSVPGTLAPAAQTPQATTPQAATVTVPLAQAAAVSVGTNEGFNAQTAAGGPEESTTWLAGLGVLLGAGAVVAVRRRSRTESPTAG